MPIAIIGGGLAGCECAWQLARSGHHATIFEMRPQRTSPAHATGHLAELVCSNSLRSDEPETAVGLLKQEMRRAGSLVMEVASATRVPAGKALAVDRERFAAHVTEAIENHPAITLVRRHVESLDDPCLSPFDAVVAAAGPLASDPLADHLGRIVGQDHLSFYDAIAPIVATDSVDMDKAFWGSRYRPEDDDYLNLPMDEAQYDAFIQALLEADRVQAREFEEEVHFEGCLPIEAMAQRGPETLAFGPLKPVGLEDPRTGRRAHAVVQLRAENLARTAMNMVGFQTRMTWTEQRRVFALIPGLERAEFLRLGSIHRNTFVNAPQALTGTLELRKRPGVYLAGQMTGVEGYVESAACGLWLGLHLGRGTSLPPTETAMGALLSHLRGEGCVGAKRFQPSNVQYGLMPPLNRRAPKRLRKGLYVQRAQEAWEKWWE